MFLTNTRICLGAEVLICSVGKCIFIYLSYVLDAETFAGLMFRTSRVCFRLLQFAVAKSTHRALISLAYHFEIF